MKRDIVEDLMKGILINAQHIKEVLEIIKPLVDKHKSSECVGCNGGDDELKRRW